MEKLIVFVEKEVRNNYTNQKILDFFKEEYELFFTEKEKKERQEGRWMVVKKEVNEDDELNFLKDPGLKFLLVPIYVSVKKRKKEKLLLTGFYKYSKEYGELVKRTIKAKYLI